ncbi:flagellar basal body-associated FliL family protein [bacterium]|nr:flagellar basal body-associated FliL family protein [bacterium]
MAEEEREIEEEKKAKGGKLPLPFMLGLTAVVAVAASLAIMMILTKGMNEKDPLEDIEVVSEEEVEFEPIITHYPLPTFRCNLKGGGYLKATVVLELSDNSLKPAESEDSSEEAAEDAGSHGGGHGGEEAEEEPALPEEEELSPLVLYLDKFRARFQDIILTILSGQTREDLLSEEGRKSVKKEIKDSINRELDSEMGQVANVFFEEFVTD